MKKQTAKKQTAHFWSFLLLAMGIIAIPGCWQVVTCCDCPFGCCGCTLETTDVPNTPIIPFTRTLDMNDPENRQKFFQLTRLEFPDSVVWESAHITYNPIPQHIFRGAARMTRKDFDTIFAGIPFREYGDHIGSHEHPYYGTVDCPGNNCDLRVWYERFFETNKAENPEALVGIQFMELKAKRASPWTPQVVQEFNEWLNRQ